jgi:S-adenosylmethionine synthetase
MHPAPSAMDLFLRTLESASPALSEVEVVERKGLGHPDTVCDALAEHFCVVLCRYYRERFGHILHHNVDKILLCGGASRAAFGGGEILEPIEIYLAGRVTVEHGGERIPVRELAEQACREWLSEHIGGLDLDKHVRIIPRLRPGSADLAGLFGRDSGAPLANDTSVGVGFAPLTDLERVVYEVERALNRGETKRTHPEIGTDVKVMGVRRGSRIDLTIGCAFIGRFLRDADDYVRKKAAAVDIALAAARRVTQLQVDAAMNVGDDVEKGQMFLTVSGTSAEAGDDGEVGRGNRTSGLITPYRPMTMEAAAGKNPVSHVGKLYNLACGRIARAITMRLPDVTDAACVLVSQIGRPVTDPQMADVRVSPERGTNAQAIRRIVEEIVHSELDRMDELREGLLDGRLTVY